MEPEPEPTGAPPTYSEATGNESGKIPRGENDDGKIYPKQPQYTWAEPIPNQCHLGEPLQFPPAQPSPGSGTTAYGPAYGQPMFTYYQHGTPYYGVAPSQAQQQQVMMVGGQQHHQPVLIQHVQSFAGHVVLSCIVIFCCNFVLGFVAFVLACIASGMAVTDPRAARQLGHASLGVSVGGIIVSIFITVVVFGVVISGPSH